ncbi:hypothetical protein AAFF_G00352260 [Aldrovandia affinis]|uniref:Uncharacterized protein n=1 Tax=Aldrovandia affinis TaxID=143900 RepID=A0AAD7WPD5_9TELE|nr:hypothetical protein AAFF_G00352260 [Aldrovandia affinis]
MWLAYCAPCKSFRGTAGAVENELERQGGPKGSVPLRTPRPMRQQSSPDHGTWGGRMGKRDEASLGIGLGSTGLPHPLRGHARGPVGVFPETLARSTGNRGSRRRPSLSQRVRLRSTRAAAHLGPNSVFLRLTQDPPPRS